MKLIPLTKGQVAAVSDRDYAYVRQFKWSLHSKGYAHRTAVGSNGRPHCILLHRVVAARAGRNTSWQIDHIDQNKLNCQRGNLRQATNSQNLANRGRQRNNTSGCKGVTWDKAKRRWVATIQVAGKQIFLGRFTAKREAYKAYCAAVRKYFGTYACTG